MVRRKNGVAVRNGSLPRFAPPPTRICKARPTTSDNDRNDAAAVGATRARAMPTPRLPEDDEGEEEEEDD